jgi:D-glycero-D-manno-heptose 1,7-bisphosphate phosphatase
LSLINVDNSWSLFLDRDGVINEKLDNDYVKNWGEFKFKEGALQAIAGLGKIFGRVFVVTNQRGVGLGLMTEEGLNEIHDRMHSEVISASGRIDKIYYCTAVDNCAECRKPNIGMGLRAKKDFLEIEFSKSVMIGDSISDMEFGKNLGMKTVFIRDKSKYEEVGCLLNFNSLIDFYKSQIIV